jgi:hypothetical protein
MTFFFHFNLDFRIFNQLGMITIITLFHLQGFKPIPLNELCTSSLDKPLVNRSNSFYKSLVNRSKIFLFDIT